MERCRQALAALAAATLCAGAWAAEEADGLESLLDPDVPMASGQGEGLRWGGYGELSGAYTYPDPGHWSVLRARLEFGASGRLGERARFRLMARADADAAYVIEQDHYPREVRLDQRHDFMLREAYVDTSAGDWEFRFGRQHVVWGEVVGIFLADVVSAREMHEFLLPEFEAMRIPQWAARAEYHGGETFFELLWIPFPSFDRVGEPGADFFPFPLPPGTPVHHDRPETDTTVDDGNWGVRVARLVAGWDLAAFYYDSRDVMPTLYRSVLAPVPAFELRHDRIRQLGLTMSKDFGNFVLKGEAVHTEGRRHLTETLGLKASDTLEYVVGVDIPIRDVWRVNVQHYARIYYSHDDSLPFDEYEKGVTLLVNRRFGDEFEAEVLLVAGLNRPDYMLRPKLVWNVSRNWRAQFGADIFGGRDKGLFGRFDDSDRVYVELRRWF